MSTANELPPVDPEKLEKLIERVGPSGGAERANFNLFMSELCGALGLPQPDYASENRYQNDYCFERAVDHHKTVGERTTHYIDLYKRGCFVMEAKQSAKRKKVTEAQLELKGIEAARQSQGHARRGSRGWDRVMTAAYNQAKAYTRDLPDDHVYPPFIITVDVGNVIEVFANFSGNGRNYGHFPDRRNYRISLEDLRKPEIQKRLRTIWTDPQSLNPQLVSAEVTTDIARRLARVSSMLEKRKLPPKPVADFLMRCLFTMYAEDVKLIPEKGFENLLHSLIEKPENFVPALEALWRNMDKGGFDGSLGDVIRRFNGQLFKDAKAIALNADEIGELYRAARRDWTDVEPAIFGTLLEQALETKERSSLGAHFTPRAYVQRLVEPTVIEPLLDDWADVQARAAEQEDAGDHDGALKTLSDFHHKLCTTRVLDPACGTGNFLYVAFELMKELEGQVLNILDTYSGTQDSLAIEGETVSPRQFLGLEINPRAVPIAELVLWIGYLKWQIKTVGPQAINEPVLHAYKNIRHQDAILAYDSKELRLGEDGKPVSVWDGETMKRHPITGEDVPDETARRELYDYANPRRADWPEAEFIVGNPPFIGGKDMRAELGDGYAEAAWKTRKDVPGGADFVMHFWDEAARRLVAKPPKGKVNPLRRFGFITTNSITQTFSRRVIEKWMGAKTPLHLTFAVPDHPWLKSSDKAAVRIAMTVAARGEGQGVLGEVVSEVGLNTDAPEVALERESGIVLPALRLGADLSSTVSLHSSSNLSFRGVIWGGDGFIVDPRHSVAKSSLVRQVVNARNIMAKAPKRYIIDTNDIDLDILQLDHSDAYSHLLETVKPIRLLSNRQSHIDYWWKFMEKRPELREATQGLPHYIVCPMTTKHRIFDVFDPHALPDQGLIVLALNSFKMLAVLSSRGHTFWAQRSGGWLGVGNDSRYNNSQTFDPFPFPACVTDNSNPALTAKLDDLGERLDRFRKERLDDWDWLTMTRMYNALERYREAMHGGAAFDDAERDVHQRAQIGILADIHDEIDRAVLDAYGWGDLAADLVGKPGGTTPSQMKSEAQEAAEEELLSRLVALNKERAAEEKLATKASESGPPEGRKIRWLRPDYQIPKLLPKLPGELKKEQIEADLAIETGPDKPSWPSDGLEQIRLVRDVLAAAEGLVDADMVTRAFKQRYTTQRRARVEDVLLNLSELGLARQMDEKFESLG